HITVTVNIDSTYRGSLEVFLASPSGVRSQLAAPRRSDSAKEGLKNWTFSSVKHWDESPVGNWTLLVRNTVAGAKGSFKDWQLTLWGENTDAPPEPQRPIMYPEIPPRVARELKSKLGTNVTFPSGSLVAPYAGDGRPLLDQQQGDEELRFTLGQTIGISVFSVAISGILAMLGYIVLRRIIRGQKSGSLWTPLGDKLSGGSGRQGGYDSAADGERGRLRPESFELDEVIVAGPAITSSNSDEYLQIHGEGEQEAQLVKMTAFNKQQQQQPSPSTIDSG
ncbi:pheromone processing endoprotease, partial [Spiromyces aspiralis]